MLSDGGIYVIINRLNGNTYVGSAVKFSRRWKKHLSDLKHGKHHSRHLQNAWDKYGDVFSFTVERWCAKDDLIRFEQEVIDLLKPEYNISPTAGGSQIGVVRSEKFREAVRKNNRNRAKKYHGMSLRQLATLYGNVVPLPTAEMRVKRGWLPVDAVTTPVLPHTQTRAGAKKK